jgi:hypothetical protein
MAEQDYPDINGYAPSWADIKVTSSITGGALIDMSDIADISWKDSLEKGVKRGAGGRKMQRTVGQGDCEASITLYRSGYRKLEQALAAVAPTRGNQKRIGLVSFNISIVHSPVGAELEPPYETLLKGCCLKGREGSHAEGPDADKITVPLDVMQIATKENGEEIVLS